MIRARYVIKEYSTISEGNLGSPSSNGIEIEQGDFDDLVSFIEENENDTDISNAFSMYRSRGRRHIKVKSHVGVIETRRGASLEILPKIFQSDGDSEYGYEETKHLFLRMLSALRDSPFIDLDNASLKVIHKFPLLEIFINAYLQQVDALLKRELRGDYQQIQEAIHYVRGKVLVSETMRRNLQVRAEVYCEYDIFTSDIAPNRLIKSTLRKLLLISSSFENKNQIRKYITILDAVGDSKNIPKDLDYCHANKAHLTNYGHLISWSEVYLQNKGFTNFSGKSVNQAILFPMEKIFEQYLGKLLRKHSAVARVELQHRKYHLVGQRRTDDDIEYLNKRFRLKPDFVLNHGEYILDAKWKLLNSKSRNNDISESDIYQMHAYGRTYQAQLEGFSIPRTCLVYPKSPNFKEKLQRMRFGNDLYLDVVPFDLTNLDTKQEVQKLLDILRN